MSAYICTVTAAALAVSVIVSLSDHIRINRIIRLAAGIFMALTVISPLYKLKLPDLQTWMSSFESDAADAAASGEMMAEDALHSIIKQRTEAYILDKAARCNASLEVDVSLDEQGIPVAVTLSGRISPYWKARLAQELTAELGFGEEALQWIE